MVVVAEMLCKGRKPVSAKSKGDGFESATFVRFDIKSPMDYSSRSFSAEVMCLKR